MKVLIKNVRRPDYFKFVEEALELQGEEFRRLISTPIINIGFSLYCIFGSIIIFLYWLLFTRQVYMKEGKLE